jgi:hypothetical protein
MLLTTTYVKNASFFIKKSFMLFFVSCVLFACQKDLGSDQQQPSEQTIQSKANSGNANSGVSTSNGITTRSECFQALAEIAHCNNGEDILFTGTIDLKEKISVNDNGQTHITRFFGVKGLTGRGVTGGRLLPATGPACNKVYTGGTFTGSEYVVKGGFEMFDIIYSPGGSPTLAGSDRFIHRGTLVFVEVTTGKKVVAKHKITKVPGQGIIDNSWDCAGDEDK